MGFAQSCCTGSTGMERRRSLGMIDGEPESQDPPALPGRYRYWGSLAVQSSGLLWPRIEPGTLVKKGQIVAEITDIFGEVVECVESPGEGFMWSFNGAQYGAGTHAVPEGSDVGFFAERVT